MEALSTCRLNSVSESAAGASGYLSISRVSVKIPRCTQQASGIEVSCVGPLKLWLPPAWTWRQPFEFSKQIVSCQCVILH